VKKTTWKTNESHSMQGEIVVNLPKYTERLRLIKSCNFKTNDGGEIVTGFDQVDSLITAIEETQKFIESVSLVTKDGQKIDSYEELEHTHGCDSILPEVAFFIINGPQLGNN